jgi:hypothetical protein
MKRKTKRFNGGYGSFATESPKSVEDMKSGLAAGAPAPDESDTYAPKTRSFTTVKPDRPKPRPKPVAKAESSSPVDDMDFQQNAAMVMKRGQAGPSDSGRNPSLDRLMSDREATASREARRKSAMVDKAKAGVPEVGSRSDAVSKQFNDASDKRKSEAQDERKLNRRRSELGDAVIGKINQVGQYALDKISGKKKGGSVKSASARADGCAIRGKTRA